MSSESVSRREFGKRVAVGPLVGCAANAGVPSGDTEKTTAPAREPADLLLDVVTTRYPHAKLDKTARAGIRSEIAQTLRQSKTLSDFPLTNADEPGFLFAAYREDAT